jgi:AcrR family transcriptional regulator
MVTKSDIKDAAFRLFARKGYAETSMDDISSAVRLKKQSLYSHFGSKAEILTEVLREQTNIMTREISAVLDELSDQPAAMLLDGIFKSYIRLFSDRDRLSLWKRIILMIGNEEYRELAEGMFSEFSGSLSISLYKAVRTKYPRLDQQSFDRFYLSYMITVFGYTEWMLIDTVHDHLFNVVWNNFWNGAADLLNAEAGHRETSD